jgi:hypothetical protein
VEVRQRTEDEKPVLEKVREEGSEGESDEAMMMEAARTSETLVDNYFTRQYIPEDKNLNFITADVL